MEIIKSILLGIVQGITEFLPISSSGHLSLFQYFLGSTGEESLLLTVLLHIGTLLAVFIVFYKTILEIFLECFKLVKDVLTGKFSFKNMSEARTMLFMFVISCVPLLVLLIPLPGDMRVMDKLKVFSTDNSILAEGVCFLLTAVLLIAGSWMAKNKLSERKISPKSALGIGIAQLVAAAFPGISRSGSTISTGLIFGLSREYMVKYSFILGIPAILAANAVEIKDAISTGSELNPVAAIVGMITAAAVGVAAIKAIQFLLKKDMFKYFGYYCAAVGVFAIVVSFIEVL